MSPDDFRRLCAAGLSSEQIAVVMEIMGRDEKALEASDNAKAEASREKARARWHKWRESHPANANKRLLTTANVSKRLVRVEDNLLTKVIEPQESKKEAQASPRDELEMVLDPVRAGAVLDHRQRLRKPLTAHAARLLAGKLSKCPDPNAAADTMIGNGWQGFDPEWLTPNTRGSPAKGPTLSERFAQLGQFANERQNGNGIEAPQQALRLVSPSPTDK